MKTQKHIPAATSRAAHTPPNAHQELEDLCAAAARGEITAHSDENIHLLGSVDRSKARQAAVLLLFAPLGPANTAPAPALPEPAGQTTEIPGAHPENSPKTWQGAFDPLLATYRPEDLSLVLVERATTLSSHPGQIALPGGSVDPADQHIAQTALREAQEEIGVDVSGVSVLGELPVVELPVSNFLVTPVVAWWHHRSEVYAVDAGETQRVFDVPVADLLNPDNRVTCIMRPRLPDPKTKMPRVRTVRSPGFMVEGVIVWGFTGMLLDHLFNQLGWTKPWDHHREIPAPSPRSPAQTPPDSPAS